MLSSNSGFFCVSVWIFLFFTTHDVIPPGRVLAPRLTADCGFLFLYDSN